MEILNEDETELITTVRAVPTRRAQTPGESDFTFDEGYADSPKPLHAWFYPGSDIGNEFVDAENQRSQNGNYHQNQQ